MKRSVAGSTLRQESRFPLCLSVEANYVMDPDNAGRAGVALLSRDRKTARNSKTGKNYALEPCPPPGTAQPTPSTTSKVTDVLRTIGSSVSVSIGGGGYTSGHDEHHHGDHRHRTAEKVSTDKTKTTSPTTTHKAVTSACKCHPCTCSPCTCR
jgi:hypothetical protein